jgi:tol-pal system protein YbgF
MKKAFVIGILPFIFVACAQDNQAIKQSISSLNEEIINLQKSIADMKVNVDELDRKISVNEEKINTNSRAIAQVRNDMSYVTNEVTIMKNRLETEPKKSVPEKSSLNIEKTQPKNDTASGNQVIVIEDNFSDKSSLYSYAYELYKSGKLFESKSKFEEFLALYPYDDLSDNAMYWIGEIYYSNNEYQKAVDTLTTLIQKYPDGNKVPDAYLKIALAKKEMGDIAGAKETLKKLIELYPDSEVINTAKSRLKDLE